MNRKEVQKLTVDSLKREISKHGPDHTYVESPLHGGRSRWTLGEALAAAEKDEELPESYGINPVTDVEVFIGYCGERGIDWKEIFYHQE